MQLENPKERNVLQHKPRVISGPAGDPPGSWRRAAGFLLGGA